MYGTERKNKMNKTLDWNEYLDKAAQTVAEGIVMLKNENKALPLSAGKEVAIFGRIQLHYYKSGTGSGGMVNVSKVTGIVDGLLEHDIRVNQELLDMYQKWDSENPFDVGEGWGMEPWCQKEMPLEEGFVKGIAQSTDTAIVVIGRTAGEEQDNHLKEGSYLLTEREKDMLCKVRNAFEKVIVLLNVGNIIDMSYLEECKVDSILYVWQGGMTGGSGTAEVLTGKVSPCGKLSDTIAYEVSDYPADKNFGDENHNFYAEDIYVGYRYFETFAKDRVRYPFGFGLSYTTFDYKVVTVEEKRQKDELTFVLSVTNTGDFAGKEVVQLYCSAPQGKLGKPSRVLCGYKKTKELQPKETEMIEIKVPFLAFASYDDSGATGYRYATLLEQGMYAFYAGTDVRSAGLAYEFNCSEDLILDNHKQALAPVLAFERIKPVQQGDNLVCSTEVVPLSEVDEKSRRLECLPQDIVQTGDKGLSLENVLDGDVSMDRFIAQFSDKDLSCIVRGEGMNSPKVTAGTAAAFGGVSKHLQEMGIPCGCCSDGPSGMRMDCGTKAFSLPNGTLLASTFNDELVTELYTLVGMEMAANKVDCLLGPGMNIHRHPLNGRNFEYFSEDPFVTGKMAVAELKGMHSAGVTGTIKHFCGNNQETYRHTSDSVISERALREIYLKGFEMAVKEGDADSVMTTYGSVNGLWTAGSYDLVTTILHDDWGFTGFTMTDWWANINERNCPVDKKNFAAMVRAQNDVYMVCTDGEENDDNVLESLSNGTLSRGELQRCATNVCNFLMHTNAMKRMIGKEEKITILNRPKDESDVDESDVKCYLLDQEATIDLSDICTDKGTNHSFSLDVKKLGMYEVTLTAGSTQSELAQIPVTLFRMGTAYGTFTWNGTNGEPVSFTKEILFESRFTMMRLYFAQSGLDMQSISLKYIGER